MFFYITVLIKKFLAFDPHSSKSKLKHTLSFSTYKLNWRQERSSENKPSIQILKRESAEGSKARNKAAWMLSTIYTEMKEKNSSHIVIGQNSLGKFLLNSLQI